MPQLLLIAPLLALLCLLNAPAAAMPLPTGELEQRCWAKHARERTRVDLREPTAVTFSNLRDGDRVSSPFAVEFAVRGMGVAPAGVKLDGSGHHHILVNRSLPTNIGAPLPFDDSHRHFGKGQTATLLDLKPGKHTLRLLFADADHRPYFLFSREITVQVLGARSSVPAPRIDPARFDETCDLWYENEVSRPRPSDEPLYFANVRDNEALASPFNLRLGVDGLGVCSKLGGVVDKTGHFIVDVLEANGALLRNFDLSGGRTQVNINLPVGNYRLRLRFLDSRGAALLPAHEMPVRVTRQERL